MAVSDITALTHPSHLFRHYVLANLQYWLDYVTTSSTDTAALDRSQSRIVRAISFAFELEEAWPSIRELIENFAAYMERRGYWEAWQWVLTHALEVAQRSQDLAGIVMLSALLARLLFRQSRFKEAITYYRRTIQTARQIGDRFNEARACTNLGYYYIEQGHWYRAEVLCRHALHLFGQMDSDHGLAHTENHLGILYTWQGLWDQACYHLERACTIWQAMGDNHGLMRGFINLGLLYVEMGYPDEALLYSTKALHQAQLTGEELEFGKIYLNFGLAYKLQGELSQAESYTRQAKIIFRRFFHLPGVVDTLENLGNIYLEQQRWSEAIECLESALEARRTSRHKHDEIQVLLYLANCELSRGNQQQASQWLKEAEHQLSQYPHAGQYYRLLAQVDELRRSLTERAVEQAAAE